MQVIAEKLVFSETTYDQVMRQIDLILPKLQIKQKEEFLEGIIEQIFSVDSEIKLRNIRLFELALNKMIEIKMIIQYEELFDRIKSRKEFEILIIYIKYVQKCAQFVDQTNLKYHKASSQFLKEKLCKFIAVSDSTYIWHTQYIKKHQYIKEVVMLNNKYVHPNKKIMELDMIDFNYNDNIIKIKIIYSFLIQNIKMFPFLDFTEIMMYWIMSIKGRDANEIHLICQMIQEMHNLCYHNVNQMLKPFAIFIDFLKLEYREDENFDPRMSLKFIIMSLTQKQLATLTEQTLWKGISYPNPDAWHYTYKNLILMTTDLKVSTILLAITQYMINQKIFGPLYKVLDNLTGGLYIYMRFQNQGNGAVELLKLFIIGAVCAQKVYLKHSERIQKSLLEPNIASDVKNTLYQIGQCLIKKCESSTDVSTFNTFLIEYYNNNQNQLNQLNPQQIDDMISQLNWLNFQGQNNNNNNNSDQNKSKNDQQNQNNVLFQVQTSNKTLRGLQNLGNTCYMNSYLQALYMTKEFRYRVFKISLLEVMRGGSKQQIQDNSQQGSKMEIEENNNQPKQSSNNSIANDETTKDNSNAMIADDENKQKQQKKNAEIEKQMKVMQYGTVFQLQKLFSLLFKSKRMYINPNFFKSILPEFFRFSFAQQDASEFGRIFLDQLERSIKNTNDNKLLDDYFIGQYDHTITCLKCKNKFVSKEKFLDISLNFCESQNGLLSFDDLLQHNFKPELFEGDNKYDCSICNEKNDAQKDTQISYLPDYVILTLNRFQYDIKTFKKIKLLSQIDIKEEINLANYQKSSLPSNNNNNNNNENDNSPINNENLNNTDENVQNNNMQEKQEDQSNKEQLQEEEQKDQKMKDELQQQDDEYNYQEIDPNIYQLYAIVVHRGSTAESGHYFTYCRDSPKDDCNWILFDDSNISTEYTLPKVLETFNTTNNSTPYLLFYQKKQHVYQFQQKFNENTYKLSERLIYSIENDDRQFMKEMENQTKAYSLLNQLKFNHQITQPNHSIYPFKRDDEDDDNNSQGGHFQGGNAGLGGMGGGGNSAIF